MTDTTAALAGKCVVLGVCGGIAAYKAVELCRRLMDSGAKVIPLMTDDATRFVGPVTFSALASERTRTSLWDQEDPVPHVSLGHRGDLVLVAPATARLMGSYAAGIADDLLTATLLVTRAPVLLCPAMHTEMWEHPAVRDNSATLARRGVQIVPPAIGKLALGDEGLGRLAALDEIVMAAARLVARTGDLVGARVLVTAGGTREPLDPVRYIGNRSSGKQGHALAEEASARGAGVTLVTTSDRTVPPTVTPVRVETASEMDQAVSALSGEADVVIMAAAVADFRPKVAAGQKLKRSEGVPEIVLEPTPDVLGALAERRRRGQAPENQLLIGFAAETGNLRSQALAKQRDKRLDLLVANDVSVPGAGFEHDTNEVLMVGADGSEETVALTDKREVARIVIDKVVSMRQPI